MIVNRPLHTADRLVVIFRLLMIPQSSRRKPFEVVGAVLFVRCRALFTHHRGSTRGKCALETNTKQSEWLNLVTLSICLSNIL